ncbi:MAG: hypothetical protein ABR598_05720 [Candidatus Dormibacteria bacterium]
MSGRIPRAQRRVERLVAAGDRQFRVGDVEAARRLYLEAARLEEEIVSTLAPSPHLGTLACGCVLLYRFGGDAVAARMAAERCLQRGMDERAEGWLMDQVSELTMGSHPVAAQAAFRSAMAELISLRQRVA